MVILNLNQNRAQAHRGWGSARRPHISWLSGHQKNPDRQRQWRIVTIWCCALLRCHHHSSHFCHVISERQRERTKATEYYEAAKWMLSGNPPSRRPFWGHCRITKSEIQFRRDWFSRPTHVFSAIQRLEIELLGLVATLLSATKPKIPISKLISLEGNPLN